MNGFYQVIPGSKQQGGSGPPLASDVNQYAKAFSGEADVGTIRLADQVASPTSGTAVAVAGEEMGVGTYQYALTFVTGHRRDDGTILEVGETTPSVTWSATTVAWYQRVSIADLQAPPSPTVVRKRLYRTTAGGTQLKLVATLEVTATTYVDMTPDAALGAAPPATNTTGSHIAYTPEGEVTATTIDGAIRQLHDKLLEERDRFLAVEAEQNVNIWQLQANVIAAREGMNGWQGEAFLNYDDQIATGQSSSNVRVVRSLKPNVGFVEGILGTGWSDDGHTFMGNDLWVSSNGLFPVNAMLFSRSGKYLAVTSETAPYFAVYKVDQDTGVLTKLSIAKDLRGQPGTGNSMSWGMSKDGYEYLGIVVKAASSPAEFAILRTNDPDNATAMIPLTNPGSWPASIYSIAITPDAKYVVMCSGTTLILLTINGTVVSNGGITILGEKVPSTQIDNLCFSPDGAYLALSYATGLVVYKRAVGSTTDYTATITSWPSPAPTIAAAELQWSADNILAVSYGDGSANPVSLQMYKVDGTSATRFYSVSLPGVTRGIRFSGYGDDDKYLFATGSTVANDAGIDVYKIDRSTPTPTVTPIGNIVDKLIASGQWTLTRAAFGRMYTFDISPDGTRLFCPAFYDGYNRNCGVRSGASNSTVASKSLELKPRQLSSVCNAIYILDDFAHVVGTGTHRKYEVSLDGGTTWETIAESQIGNLVRLNHTGSNLIVRLVLYHDLGDTSKARIYWIAAFATSI